MRRKFDQAPKNKPCPCRLNLPPHQAQKPYQTPLKFTKLRFVFWDIRTSVKQIACCKNNQTKSTPKLYTSKLDIFTLFLAIEAIYKTIMGHKVKFSTAKIAKLRRCFL